MNIWNIWKKEYIAIINILHSCSLDKKQESKAKRLGYWSPKRKTRLTDHLQVHAKKYIKMVRIIHSFSLEKKQEKQGWLTWIFISKAQKWLTWIFSAEVSLTRTLWKRLHCNKNFLLQLMFTGQKTVPLIKTLVLNLYANLYSGSRRMTPPTNI